VSLLHGLGYTNVRDYPGGLAEWQSEGPGITHPATRIQHPAAGPRIPNSKFSIPNSLSARFVDALAERTVGGLFWLWIDIVLGCGVVYWLMAWASPRFALMSNGVAIPSGLRGLLPALYFSAVTATSIGYGDIVPTGAARVLAVFEGIAGLILFGCVVSKFVSRRQDELIGEIHRIAFEDRLGRVRTNLLLVRSELQAITRLCQGREVPPPEAVARVESAAMVFVGELHAVHDLLYRPQQTPEEAILEAILAGLASVFREFNELLACVQAPRAAHPPALAASVATMSRLAREICGDCVPREFAPGLRTWMDQIQRLAGEVEQI
jgi:potassium channel LctB